MRATVIETPKLPCLWERKHFSGFPVASQSQLALRRDGADTPINSELF